MVIKTSTLLLKLCLVGAVVFSTKLRRHVIISGLNEPRNVDMRRNHVIISGLEPRNVDVMSSFRGYGHAISV